MTDLFAPKQKEFIVNSQAKFNLAHGSFRSGKTVCTLFRFLKAVALSEGESICIFGYSQSTIYANIISLVFTSPQLAIFKPFATWSAGKHELLIGSKSIRCIGCGDEGALGLIQGMTLDLCLCDEMTLYPDSVIEMIRSRLSRPDSQLFASMNPKQPDHILKKWIDRTGEDPLYYSLHFSMEDNPFLPESYVQDMKNNLSGIFYKRNYLGIWCLAEGAIFDFFDRSIHVTKRPPRAANYYIAGIDYGTRNPTACVILGVSTGIESQTGRKIWAEKEYYWDCIKTGRQKTGNEFARDIKEFLEPYGVRAVYIDPSALPFKLELQRLGIHCVEANNEVLDGIQIVASLMQKGVLTINDCCHNLIKEVEGYCWDPKKAKIGEDAPLKIADHAIDAMRYALATHKVPVVREEPKPWDGVNRGYMRMG